MFLLIQIKLHNKLEEMQDNLDSSQQVKEIQIMDNKNKLQHFKYLEDNKDNFNLVKV